MIVQPSTANCTLLENDIDVYSQAHHSDCW